MATRSRKQIILLQEIYDNKCFYCEKVLTDLTATRDHIVPVSMGGKDKLSNMVLSCTKCNSLKSDNTEGYEETLEIAKWVTKSFNQAKNKKEVRGLLKEKLKVVRIPKPVKRKKKKNRKLISIACDWDGTYMNEQETLWFWRREKKNS